MPLKIPVEETGTQKILRKLLRLSGLLFVVMLFLMIAKYKQDQARKVELENEKRHAELAAAQKEKEEVNWDERLKLIVPEQEDLLSPNVVPQLMVPPIVSKIDVPQALVYERKKRYTAAYEVYATRAMSFWNAPASASVINDSPAIAVDLPAVTPPLSQTSATPPRKPKPPRGVSSTYILLP